MMSVDELDRYFTPEVERCIQLRDACRAAVLHHARCVAEVAALETAQRANLARPVRSEAVRRTGQSLDQARVRRD
jgi:hypothetical protein